LLIESEGNAHSPVEFDLGHHLRASVFSVAGGDDKATEYPFLIAGSDVVLLTKMDLLPVVTFDFNVFNQDVVRIKPKMAIIQLSVQSNQGISQWVEWVESHLSPGVRDRTSPRSSDPFIRFPKQ
jgi:hydrogenase nickel incorporation protein HypB